MKKKFNIITFIFIFLVSSCGGKSNNDFDFSSFKKPVIEKQLEEKKSLVIEEQKPVKYELKALKKREEVFSSIRFGRKDPFALSSASSITLSKLKLKGFITISDENYAMVSYLDNEGPVSIESIGGVNTNLLPEGALISEIKVNKGYIKISHESENFIIFLKK